MSSWSVILGMAAVTYALRALPFVLGRGGMDAALERWLRYLPPALFAALIAPSLLAPGGTLQIGPRFWAGLVGVVTAWRTRSIPATIVVGLGALAFLRWLAGK